MLTALRTLDKESIEKFWLIENHSEITFGNHNVVCWYIVLSFSELVSTKDILQQIVRE